MTHEEIKILISAYFDNEVTPSEKNIVEEHLSTCPDCQKDYKMYTAISSSLSKWSNETLSPDEEINVQRRFEQRREPMFTKRTLLTFASTLAIAIIVGSVVQQGIKHGVYGRLKSSADDMGDQYSSRNTNKATDASTHMAASDKKVAQYQPYYVQSNLVTLATARDSGVPESLNYAPITTAIINDGAKEPTNYPQSVGISGGRLENVYDQAARLPRPMGAYNKVVIVHQDIGGMGDQLAARPAYENGSFALKQGKEYWDRSDAGTSNEIYNVNYNPYSYPNSYNYPQYYPYEPYRIQNAPSNTEQYERIYENPFLAAQENPLSTFSISVDTGSYTNVRSFIMNGQMPPKDAVQLEEMINYFHYDYPQPQWGEPFSITTELMTCPWNRNHNLVLVGLQGKKIPLENLPPSNLVFLIDVSGSMGDYNKLSLVKSALHLLVEQLRPQDKVSIVVFAGSATSVLESASGNEKDRILQAIDSLEAGGSTNGEDGLQNAYRAAKENFIKNGNNRIIVTTDGDFNVGTSDDADLVRMIEQKRDEGVYLSVFGFGMGNIKPTRMEKLADSGHGNYDYIDSMDEARKEFVSQLSGTLYGIAKDVKIQVEFNPAQVKAYRLIGYENKMLKKEDFNNDQKDAGVIGSGHTVTALYEIVPPTSHENFNSVDALKYQTTTPASVSNTSDEVMTVKLRYKNPKEDKSKLIIKTIKKDELSSPGSDNIRFAASVAEFGMLLRDSQYKGTSTYLGVMTLARLATGEDKDGYHAEFLQMVEKAGLMTTDVKLQHPAQQN